MAKPNKATLEKRRRERMKAEKRAEKQERKATRKAEKSLDHDLSNSLGVDEFEPFEKSDEILDTPSIALSGQVDKPDQ